MKHENVKNENLLKSLTLFLLISSFKFVPSIVPIQREIRKSWILEDNMCSAIRHSFIMLLETQKRFSVLVPEELAIFRTEIQFEHQGLYVGQFLVLLLFAICRSCFSLASQFLCTN